MAYKRRYRKRTKKASKPSGSSWLSTGMNVAQTAMKALTLAKGVAALVNTEIKKHDVYSGSTSIPNTGVIVPLSNITQGDLVSQRHGNSIKVKGLQLKALYANNGTVDDTATTIMLVRDNQQVADSNPSLSDIIDTSYGHFCVLNRNTVGRFSILWKQTYTQDISRKTVDVEKYLSLDNHIRYNGTADTDIQKGGYYLVMVSNKSTNVPSITYLTRLSYIDN